MYLKILSLSLTAAAKYQHENGVNLQRKMGKTTKMRDHTYSQRGEGNMRKKE
jgi:hypothetical protein